MLLKDLVRTLDKESFCDLIIYHKNEMKKFNSNTIILGKLSELVVKSISFETCDYDGWINVIVECK